MVEDIWTDRANYLGRSIVMKIMCARVFLVICLGAAAMLINSGSVLDATAQAETRTNAPVGSNGPVVVELYQSQGCSSCPPANAALNAIAERSDVIALSFAVTYWDRLGWKDVFGDPAYTKRQYAYANALGNDGVYTPQVAPNGRRAIVGNRPGELERAVAATGKLAEGHQSRISQDRCQSASGWAPAMFCLSATTLEINRWPFAQARTRPQTSASQYCAPDGEVGSMGRLPRHLQAPGLP